MIIMQSTQPEFTFISHNQEGGDMTYHGEGFKITMQRYSDPDRKNLARNAAIYLDKPDRDNVKRPLNILRDGHVTAIFRGEHVEFEFEGVSKEVYDHLITYTTATMRAAGGNRANVSTEYAMPSDKMKNEEVVRLNIETSMHAYQLLLDNKETKQVARSAMPVAAKLRPFVFQFNFVTLGESLFKQRIWEKGAQSNTAKVVEGMFKLCQYMDPELWGAFYEYKGTPALAWTEVRKRLVKKDISLLEFKEEIDEVVIGQNGNPSLVEYLTKKYGGLHSMW
jgi:hypothetical protein